MNTTIAEVPSFINPAQAACLKEYMDGDCEYFLQSKNETEFSAQIEAHGDTFLKFLVAELSSREDCISVEEATNRISIVMKDLSKIRDAIDDLPNTKWEKILDHTNSSDERKEIMTYDEELEAGKQQFLAALPWIVGSSVFVAWVILPLFNHFVFGG